MVIGIYLIFFIITLRDRFKEVIKSVANSKINETYALAKLKIISLANDNKKDPVRFFVKKYKKIDILKM